MEEDNGNSNELYDRAEQGNLPEFHVTTFTLGEDANNLHGTSKDGENQNGENGLTPKKNEGINIANILSSFKYEKGSKIMPAASIVITKTISFLEYQEQSPETIIILRKLLYRVIDNLSVDDITKFNKIFIPEYALGDYDKGADIIGLGKAVKLLVNRKDIQTEDKNIILMGWIQICKLKRKTDPFYEQNIDIDTLVDILEQIRSKSPAIEITTDQMNILNERVPWSEEITGYSLYTYLINDLNTEESEDTESVINEIRDLILYQVPESLLFQNRKDKNNLLDGLENISFKNAGSTSKSEIKQNLFYTVCNVGVVDLVRKQSKMWNDDESLFLGSLFQRFVKFRDNANFNKSVVEALINDLSNLVDLHLEKKSMESMQDRKSIDCSKAKKKIDSFISKKKRDPGQRMEFHRGCIILNMHSNLFNMKSSDVPTIFRDYFGERFDANSPQFPTLPESETGKCDETIEGLFSEYETLYSKNIYKLGETQFKTKSSDVFVGVREDKAVYSRYNAGNVFTMPFHLHKKFIASMFRCVSEKGIRHVLAGGLACMLRFNGRYPKEFQWHCTNFMHIFSPHLLPFQIQNFEFQNKKTPNKDDISILKEEMKINAYHILFNSQLAYSRLFEYDAQFQSRIDAVFDKLRDGRSFEALMQMCDIDIIFAENLVLFGFAVFFRGCLDAMNYSDGKIRAFDNFFNEEKKKDDVLNSTTQFFRNESNKNVYWNVLSVIIHAWDSDERRFANIGNLKKRMPIFRWEIMNLFFQIMLKSDSSFRPKLKDDIKAGNGRVPKLRSEYLQNIDSMLNSLLRLSIYTDQ